MTSDALRFPVGRFTIETPASGTHRREWIDQVDKTPARLRAAVAGLTDARLDTPYREDGWTVRQLIHHLPDSHLNACVRMKLALTEDAPAIKTYDEARWADLPDSRDTPPEVSLALLEALHRRWVTLLRTLGDADWARSFRHPEMGDVTVERALALYAWHGRHHVAHVTALRERMGW